MAYEKLNLPNGIKLNAAHLAHIEDGISNVSYDDLKDKPFYTERAVGTVLPETNIIPNSDMQATIGTKLSRMFAGETYTVNWNGTSYECVCSEMTEAGTAIAVLGNLGLLTGGEDTGEPFIVMAASPDWNEAVSAMGGYAVVYALDGSTIATLSIEGLTEIAHTLDPSYVPKMRDVSSAIVLDLDTTKASIPLDAALRMDMAELQTNLVVIYNGEECSVSGIQKTEQVIDGKTIGKLFVGFRYLDDGIKKASSCSMLTFQWSLNGFSEIVESITIQPFAYYSSSATNAYIYGSSLEKTTADGNTDARWHQASNFIFEGVLLRSTTNGSLRNFLLTVDDAGTLSVTEAY